MIRVVRSWPAEPPAGHARVDDGFDRLLNQHWDYSGLARWQADVIHLDWDIAVSLEDLTRFARYAQENRDRVLVAPYKSYPGGLRGEGNRPRALTRPVWTAQKYNPGEQSMRYVATGEKTCHLFGFGMVYLPAGIVARYLAERPDFPEMTDVHFAGWHYRAMPAAQREVRITWDVRPVHLNYPPPAGLP